MSYQQFIGLTIFVLGFQVPTVSANEGNVNYFYFGGSYGEAEQDSGVTVQTASLDETDSAHKIYFGYQYTKNLAVEVFYADFGQISLKGDSGDTFTSTNGTQLSFTINGTVATAAQDTFGVAAVFGTDVTSNAGLFAKAGIHAWDYDEKWTATGVDLSSNNQTDSGTDAFYGFGGFVDLSENISIRAEYEMFKLGGEGSDTDFISLGVVYKLDN